MDIRLIQYFNCALADEPVKNATEFNKIAIMNGYAVDPKVCNESVMKFINHNKVNYNATFYQTWDDILSKSRFELYIDQIIHYASTYGTDFQAPAYIPNDETGEIPDIENPTVISVTTKEELFSRCMKMLTSGIALKEDTIDALCGYVISFIKGEQDTDFDIDSIKNREAKCRIATALDIYPSNPVEFLRLIIYKTTGSTLLIKGKDMYDSIANSKDAFDFSKLKLDELKSLSSIFRRFKPIFMALKCAGHDSNTYAINRISRLSKRYNKPMHIPLASTLLSERYDIKTIHEIIKKLTPFKKVALMQTIKFQLMNLDERFYVIRNGKVYVKPMPQLSQEELSVMTKYYTFLYTELYRSLVKDVKKYAKANDIKTYRMPEGISLAVPSSEKTFIGNYPCGTSVTCKEDTIAGIYWRNEWGTRDFDLHVITEDGSMIGWDGAYSKKVRAEYVGDDADIIFSGDMTNAAPEATELIYFKNGVPNSIFKVCRFNGNEMSRFKLFVGTEKVKRFRKNYMCDPNSIKIEAGYFSKERETTVGMFRDGEFVLMNFQTGNQRTVDEKSGRIIRCMKSYSRTFVNLENLLIEAGLVATDEETAADLDLTTVTKDAIVKIFS